MQKIKTEPKAKSKKIEVNIDVPKPQVVNTTTDWDAKIQHEMLKLKDQQVFVESEDTPDNFKNYPVIAVCSPKPREYVYYIMMKLEQVNIVRLTAVNTYIPTVLRLVELFEWCMDLKLKRRRQITNMKTQKPLIVYEFILEKIPACRR